MKANKKTVKKTEAENMPDGEKDIYNGVIYSLFEEFADELSKQTEAEKAEELRELARFAEIEGVKINSPYYMLFMGFRAGVAKGLEFVARTEKAT